MSGRPRNTRAHNVGGVATAGSGEYAERATCLSVLSRLYTARHLCRVMMEVCPMA